MKVKTHTFISLMVPKLRVLSCKVYQNMTVLLQVIGNSHF